MKNSHYRSVNRILHALPVLFLFPFIGFDIFNYLLEIIKTGNTFFLIFILSGMVGISGFVFMDRWRGLSFFLFSVICGLGCWQGALLREIWPIWIEKGYQTLIATFALNFVPLLLIPFVIFAAKSRIKVERSVVFGFKLVLGIQLTAMVLSCLYFYGSYEVNPLGLIVMNEVPVIDSFGVRQWSFRLSGIVHSPNEAGVLFLLLWPVLLLNYPLLRDRLRFFLRTLFLVLTLVGVLFTYSRASYIGLCLQLVFLFIIAVRSEKISKPNGNSFFLFSIPFASVFLLSLISEDFRLRWIGMLNPTDASVGNRIKVFSSALLMLAERPFCGWGVGTFNTLYNVYYKIPLVSYGFADAHSAVLLSLLNIGIGGWALIIIAIFGIAPWKTFRILPIWVTTGLIGIVVPLLTDNIFTRKLAISVPLCLMMGIVYLYSRRWDLQNKSSNNIYRNIIGAIFILWILNFLIAPTSPGKRLEILTKQIASRARADISLIVKNNTTQENFTVNPDTPYPSYLGTISLAAHACQSLQSSVIDVSSFKFSPSMEPGTTVSLSGVDWMKLILSNPMHESIGDVYNAIPHNALLDARLKILNRAGFESVSLPDSCFTCTAGEGKDQIAYNLGLKDNLTTITVKQLLNAYHLVSDSSTRSGVVGAKALAENQDYNGLLRYIPRNLNQYHSSADLGDIREEVLISDKGWVDSWSVCMYYHSHSPMLIRTDSLSNRIFADIGWRIHCYFEALEPMAKSYFSSDEKEVQSGLWFLWKK